MELSTKPLRMVVFDLDETLGSFIEISMFWEALELYYGYNLLEDRFFEVLDTFPYFLRPKILIILDYLKQKKERKICDQIMIYTNNQGQVPEEGQEGAKDQVPAKGGNGFRAIS